MTLLCRMTVAALTVFSLPVPWSAVAQSGDDRYSIMRPEPGRKADLPPDVPTPWLAPQYRSPRGTVEKPVKPPNAPKPPQRHAVTPPPIVVPETGRALPNMAPSATNGPGGTESFHDRAARCTQQAGVYGTDATGDRGTYVRGCINQ